MTQHPILYATRYGMIESRDKVFYNQFKEVTIGNDVWIGCNSLIMGGVRIGDGALIGAGTRISKDVPPYAIVIGNNIIHGYRFSEDIIKALLDLQWWNLPYEVIKDNIAILGENPTIERIEQFKQNIGLG